MGTKKGFVFKMTPEQFIRKVAGLYQEARHPRFYHPSVKRGLSHSISGFLEDLMAAFIAFNAIEPFEFLVNQSVKVGGETIIPDIVLVRNGEEITNLVDVKTDLGWKRKEFSTLCKDQNNRLGRMLGKPATTRDGLTKQKLSLRLLKTAKYHVVVVMGVNISEEMLAKHKTFVKTLKHMELYVLCEGQSLNVYDKNVDEIMDAVTIRHDEFESLMGNLT